ncbi:MAG: hypothetical protein B6I19_09330 [Bacteroidetes bacterium 4572_114]|nr:MAG: hypothetical protein B6I19_09330 [Bacteroidetes bacterium 4572_114]
MRHELWHLWRISCLYHQHTQVRYKITHCVGCRPRNKQCAFLIKRCTKLMNKEVQFCFECDEFPCGALQRLDGNYRKRFDMGMVENLNEIKNSGIEIFLQNQQEKYQCPGCGSLMSVHNAPDVGR